MNRILTLAAAAVLLAGCGRLSLPGFGAAGTTEPAPAVVATQPAQPQTVVYEIHQDAPPAVVNTNTNTTTAAAAEPAVEQVVYVSEENGHRGYRHHGPPPVMILRPVIREPFDGPRDRPRYEPPRVPDRPNPPPGRHVGPLPGGQGGGVPPGKRVGPLPGGQKGGAPPDAVPRRDGTPDSDRPPGPGNGGPGRKGRG